MKNRILALLLFIVVISLVVGTYVIGDVAAQDDGSVTADDDRPIPDEWPEGPPGQKPDLLGVEVPYQAPVYSEPSLDKVDQPTAPAIDVWYGANQKFGQLGNPQQWINVVGNVSGLTGATATYQLNGGPEQDLSLGTSNIRLAETGDFNVQIDYADLNPGNNQVKIMATNGISSTETTVNVNYTSGQTWNTDYVADWSSSSDIQDIAQVVDGYWQLDGNSTYVDADNWGFDRLLAIGDETWTDYEVTVPITVYGIDPAGYGGASNGPAVGLILRWQGHNLNEPGEQLYTGIQRLGAWGFYRWQSPTQYALELRGIGWRGGESYKTLEFGEEYIFKMSVQSIPNDNAFYRLKFWKASEPEPAGWDLDSFSNDTSPDTGSLLLAAHHVDAKFGEVTIKDLNKLRLKVIAVPDDEDEGSIVFDPDQEDYAYGQRVFVSALPAYGYDFAGWSGDFTGTSNPANFRVYRDMSMTARFEPKAPTKLDIKIDGQGSVNKDPDKAEYLWGEEVTLTAVPGSGSVFQEWTGDVTGIQNPIKTVMDQDKEVTAVFVPKALATPRSDDFSQCVLNTRLWDVINPAGDAQISLVDNMARFNIPSGSTHNLWENNMDALRIVQPTANKNFEIEMKLDDLPSAEDEMAGILVQQDNQNWLRFDFFYRGAELRINAAKTIGNKSSNIKVLPLDSGGSTTGYLKVGRNGSVWTQSYSFDGENWTTFVQFSQPLQVSGTGIFVGNTSATPVDYVADVDYIFNTAAPIDPEDQGNTINTTVIGQGQVQVSPLKETYACGEKVTLTATPANEDWLFYGWSGDYSGSQNPATLTVDGDYEIIATFSEGVEWFLPMIMGQ